MSCASCFETALKTDPIIFAFEIAVNGILTRIVAVAANQVNRPRWQP
jgi:hypothetical protein